MGQEVEYHNKLSNVLLVGPPKNLGFLRPKYPQKYKLSKAWDTSLPLQEFMDENHYEGSMFEALICWPWDHITANVLQHFPCLKLVLTTSIGTDHIDLRECLTNILEAYRFVRTPLDFPFPSNFKLGGKKVGIVGLGRIGMEVAKRLEAFGCIISYHSRNEKPFVSYPFYSNMVELAAMSDALVLCCSLNQHTRHMVNKEVLLALGKRGVIVNVGRGALIDEEELVKCLKEGQIGGAGLDVFENEPNIPQELLEMDNVLLSPHSASFTFETHIALTELVIENLEALFSDKPLITPVGL